MIRSNLAVLLAERNVKITRVSEVTGISRTTLTALNNNYGRGIQFDTINTLCNYLKITPSELISYIPIDIEITGFSLTEKIEKAKHQDYSVHIELKVIKNMRTFRCTLLGCCLPTYRDGKLVDLQISIELLLMTFP